MIQWSQQLKNITDIFFSFQNGKKTHLPLTQSNLEKDKMFLSPSKFETFTLSNFKILLYYIMYNEKPSSKIDFLKRLNSLDKQDIKNSGKLRSDVLSYAFIINKDSRTLETLDITPYEAFKKSLIHPFSLANYYEKNTISTITGRIMEKDIKSAKVLKSYFKFPEST
jgi:hypothetical protein